MHKFRPKERSKFENIIPGSGRENVVSDARAAAGDQVQPHLGTNCDEILGRFFALADLELAASIFREMCDLVGKWRFMEIYN